METFTIIKLKDKYLLLSDKEIKESDWYFDSTDKEGLYPVYQRSQAPKFYSGCKKIIAGIPELPSIDFSLLSEEDYKTIGYIDVEKLAYEYYTSNEHYRAADAFHFSNGFKKAQSLNDKMFSLEDMREAIAEAWNSCEDNENGETFTQCFNRIIQSLQQNVWDVEVEMEFVEDPSDYNSNPQKLLPSIFKPKITNNSIKVLRIL